jgi:hypothetical protein
LIAPPFAGVNAQNPVNERDLSSTIDNSVIMLRRALPEHIGVADDDRGASDSNDPDTTADCPSPSANGH